jgi:riboflavin biosynthesis pyrimidine reductase
VQQIYPAQRPITDPVSIYDNLAFPEPPPERAWVYVNMVSSIDGRAQVDGRAVGLGSKVDQSMMRRLRARADCILNGSGTVQADQVYGLLAPELVAMRRARGQADEPLWAVVTASGRIRPDSTLLRKTGARPIAFVAEATPADRRAALGECMDVHVAGDERPDLVQVHRVLRHDYGCRAVLSEGGPTLNRAGIDADVLDELFLTFAPKIAAGDGKTIVWGPQFPLGALPLFELVTLFEHESELFFRYRRRPA